MKRIPKKPTGETIMSKVLSGPDGVTIDNIVLKYPQTKEGVEKYIVDMFFSRERTPEMFPSEIVEYKQNQTDDFDFLVQTRAGERYLELMEVAPLEGVKGGYGEAPGSYSPYKFANDTVEKALGKSKRYRGNAGLTIDLLLYTTHWAFMPSNSAMSLMQYWFNSREHCFAGVYLYVPIAVEEGISFLIHPTPDSHWNGFDPEKLKEGVVHNLHPSGWKIGKPDKS